MFCPNCGNTVQDNEQFCGSCGASLNFSKPETLATEVPATGTTAKKINKKPIFIVCGCVFAAVIIGFVAFQLIHSANLSKSADAAKNYMGTNLQSSYNQDYSNLGNTPDNNQSGGIVVTYCDGYIEALSDKIRRNSSLPGQKGEQNTEASLNCSNPAFLNIHDDKLFFYDSKNKKVKSCNTEDFEDVSTVFECGKTVSCSAVHNIFIYKDMLYVICSNSKQIFLYGKQLPDGKFDLECIVDGQFVKSRMDNDGLRLCASSGTSYTVYWIDVPTGHYYQNELYTGKGSLTSFCFTGNKFYALVSGSSNKMIKTSAEGDYTEIDIPFKAQKLDCLGSDTFAWNSSGDIAWYSIDSNISHDLSDFIKENWKPEPGIDISYVGNLNGCLFIVNNNNWTFSLNLDTTQ